MEIRTGTTSNGISTVTDGVTTVTSATTLTFVGATVTNGGGGNATVTITGSGVSSVTAANSTLTISPTIGAVIAGLNLANANTWTAAQVITAANASNFVPLTINQNDVTNNLVGLKINNAGTGNSVNITPTGNTGSSASVSGALYLNNTSNPGIGANFYTNSATGTTAGLVFAKSDNASATFPVYRIDQDGTGPSMKINQNGNTGTVTGSSGAFVLNQAGTGFGAQFYSNGGAGNGALVHIEADNTLWDQPLLEISTAGTNGGAANIKLLGPVPQIEWIENDQVSPAGKFETGVNGDLFYIAGRNSADNSFEVATTYNRLANGGGINFIGTTSGQTTLRATATASGTLTLPAVTDTIAVLGTAQTFTALQQIQLTTQQFSLNYDGTNKAAFTVSSAGVLTITPTGGQTTITGAGVITGGFAVTSNTNNLYIPNGTSAVSTAQAQYQYASSSTNFVRTNAYGGTSTTLTTGVNYSNFMTANAPITTFSSGTHAWLANAVIKSLGTVTSGGAAITNTAALYVDGVSAAGTNNYALYIASGNTVLNNGNFTLNTAGNKINIATGSNASVGTATLSGGTVTVSTTAVTASSKIFLTDATTGVLTNIGTPTVGTIVAGTSFVINSSNVLDASNVNWFIIN